MGSGSGLKTRQREGVLGIAPLNPIQLGGSAPVPLGLPGDVAFLTQQRGEPYLAANEREGGYLGPARQRSDTSRSLTGGCCGKE